MSDRPARKPPRVLGTACLTIVFLMVGALVFIWMMNIGEPDFLLNACHSNVKQLTLAMRTYATDQAGLLPPTDCWPSAVTPYFRENSQLLVLRCPSDRRKERQSCAGLETSYCMNLACGGAEAKMGNANQVPLLWDGEVLRGGRSSLAPRHRDHIAVVGFADGHARRMLEAEFATRALKPEPPAPGGGGVTPPSPLTKGPT